MIEHIVINGGGPTGLISYGVLRHLFQEKFVDINNIKSIYGSSIGGLFGVIISLKYDWDTLDDYIMKRPWKKVLKVELEDFFNLFYTKGLFSFSIVEEFLKYLLEAKDLSIHTTLKQYYEYNNIDHHFITVEINSFKKIDLNHITHPDLSLIKAIEMTCAFPILCKPVFINNDCYIDGGLLDNYPLKLCLDNEKCKKNQILGIKNIHEEQQLNITENMNLLEYLQTMMNHIIIKLRVENEENITIPNEVVCICKKNLSNYTQWLTYLTEIDKREELIQNGKNFAELFLKYHTQLQEDVQEDVEEEDELH